LSIYALSNPTHGWADVDDFATAYFVAVAMHGFNITEAMRDVVMRGYKRGIVSHEKSALHREMFPAPPDGVFRPTNFAEFSRRCKAVDEEYRRRRAAMPT
jgi:hypothetical protein